MDVGRLEHGPYTRRGMIELRVAVAEDERVP
jgi:hypothetical protein